MNSYHANAVINTSTGTEVNWSFDVNYAKDEDEAEAMVRELLNIMNIDDTKIMCIEVSEISH